MYGAPSVHVARVSIYQEASIFAEHLLNLVILTMILFQLTEILFSINSFDIFIGLVKFSNETGHEAPKCLVTITSKEASILKNKIVSLVTVYASLFIQI